MEPRHARRSDVFVDVHGALKGPALPHSDVRPECDHSNFVRLMARQKHVGFRIQYCTRASLPYYAFRENVIPFSSLRSAYAHGIHVTVERASCPQDVGARKCCPHFPPPYRNTFQFIASRADFDSRLNFDHRSKHDIHDHVDGVLTLELLPWLSLPKMPGG